MMKCVNERQLIAIVTQLKSTENHPSASVFEMEANTVVCWTSMYGKKTHAF